MKKWQFLFLTLIIFSMPTLAQQTCPADILRAFARAGSACTDLARNQVCIGNGTVNGLFDASNQDTFELVGERADTGFMQQLMLAPSDEYPVASMRLQLSLLDTQPGRNASVLAFGDVTMTNQVPVRPTISVESTGLLTIRARPDNESDIIEQYPLRTSVTAIGRYSEGNWLQVEVPNTSDTGWVALEILTTTNDINSLNIVDVDTPLLRPFQVMTIATATDDAPCDNAPESGILLQSPNIVDSVELTINGIDVLLSGTVFLQAVPDSALYISQLDGNSLLRIGTQTQWIVAGSQSTIDLDTAQANIMTPEPLEILSSLPLNNLNYRIQLPETLSQADIDQQIIDLTAQPILISDNSMMNPERCVRVANGDVTLFAGAGTFYEVIRVVQSGTVLYPVLRLTDSDGVIWWQLSNSHWMLANNAQIRGDCGEIPITQVVDAPNYNTLSLETCDTTNGPVRAGQWVRIEFTVGSWETLAEALQAVQIDRGSITVNQESRYVSADYPILVSEDRYYRVFYGNWFAEFGTYRIVGNRLSYSVICDITVPVG